MYELKVVTLVSSPQPSIKHSAKVFSKSIFTWYKCLGNCVFLASLHQLNHYLSSCKRLRSYGSEVLKYGDWTSN